MWAALCDIHNRVSQVLPASQTKPLTVAWEKTTLTENKGFASKVKCYSVYNITKQTALPKFGKHESNAV